MAVRSGYSEIHNSSPVKVLMSSLKMAPFIEAYWLQWSGMPYVPFDNTTNPQGS